MNNQQLIDLIDSNKIISCMMTKHQIYGVIYHLNHILKNNIEGDIVELGCNVGTTSLFIKKILNYYKSNKEYHVYDSWQGLPEKHKFDFTNTRFKFDKGSCTTSKNVFILNFIIEKLEIPTIHSGWFKEINDKEYPNKICFAFLGLPND